MQFIHTQDHSIRVDSILSIEWDYYDKLDEYTGEIVKVNLIHGHSLYLSRKDCEHVDMIQLSEKVLKPN